MPLIATTRNKHYFKLAYVGIRNNYVFIAMSSCVAFLSEITIV